MTQQQQQSAQQFSLVQWSGTQVKKQIVPLLPKGEEDWPSFAVALQSALTKDDTYGKGTLRMAIADNPEAALLAMVRCVRLGLSLDPAKEHFALIPYKTVVQGQIQYRGYLHMISESGLVEDAGSDVIYRQEYSKDVPLVDRATGLVLHQPHHMERGSYSDKDIIGAYAWVKLTTRPRIVSAILDRARIERLRSFGIGDTPAWRDHYVAMCKAKAWKTLGKDPSIPMQRRQALEELGDPDLEVMPRPNPVPVRTPPAQTTVVEEAPARAVANPDWDAAQEENFKQRQEDPLPSPEQMAADLRKQVRALQDEKGLSMNRLLAKVKTATGQDLAIDQLTAEQCEKVLAELRK